MTLLALRGVGRRFGDVTALVDVDLALAAGDRLVVVGRNGAGKSTLLRILVGYVDPDVGTVVRTPGVRVGYAPEQPSLPSDLEVQVYLRSRAMLRGVARAARRAAVDDVVRRLALGDVATRRIGTLSKGFRQRVVLAEALVASPQVLVFDEPTAGLDPVQVRDLLADLVAVAGERALVLSTHALAEVEPIATRIMVVRGGRVVADATPAALRATAASGALADAVLALLDPPAVST